MKVLRFTRLALAAAAVTLAWGVAPGCGPSAASYCNKVCDCQGCDDDQRQSCVENVQDAQTTAKDAGCSAEWSNYFSCNNAEAECTNDHLTSDGCEAERKALSDCGGGSVADCAGLCDAFAECQGSDPSTCLDSCDQQQSFIDESGCNTEWSGYIDCLLGVEDLCNFNGEECIDQAIEYSDCFSAFCSSHPNSSGCGGIEEGGAGGAAGGSTGGAGGSF